MTREDYLKTIDSLEKDFNKLFVKADGTEIQLRIWTHIAEARIILDIRDNIDDEWVKKVCDHLFENHHEVLEINDRKKYFDL